MGWGVYEGVGGGLPFVSMIAEGGGWSTLRVDGRGGGGGWVSTLCVDDSRGGGGVHPSCRW